jgi:hypothetical protein
MLARLAFVALTLASFLPPAADRVLASTTAGPALTVPAGWAGIWSVNAVTVDCTTGTIISSSAYYDTLCVGDTTSLWHLWLTRSTQGYMYPTCTGPGFSDTAFDLTCSIGAVPCGYFGTCNASYTDAWAWTRNGDNATATKRDDWAYSGPALPPPTSGCSMTTETRIRIAPAANCSSPPPPSLTGTLELDPGVLNKNSHARWLTAHITPPAPYSAMDINVLSLRLNGVPFADDFPVSTEQGNTVLRVRFDREAVVATLAPGDSVPVTLEGIVGSASFIAVDAVKVPGAIMTTPQAGAHYPPGALVPVSWQLFSDDPVQTVTLLSTFDDGLTWNVEAEGIPNTGNVTWVAPSSPVPSVRLGIASVLLYDETGPVNRVEYAVGGPIAIESVAGVDDESGTFALYGISPQPSRGSFRVSFRLPQTGSARLEVIDLVGRRVAQRDVSGGGLQQIDFGRTERLPPGVYVVRLTRAGQSRTATAVVLR